MPLSIDEQVAEMREAALLFGGAADLFVDADPSTRRAKAEVIATFGCLCAPADPSPEGMLLSVRLLTIILYLDDLSKDRLELCGREMLQVLRTPNHAPTQAQARALQAYVHELDGYGDTTWFRLQFERCLFALGEEATLLSAGPVTASSYRALRPRVIFLEEYLWTWLLSERLPFDAAALGRTARLRQLASEVAYLVNDVGSIERDRASRHDSNLVLLIQGEQGTSEAIAVETVIRLHDDTALAYRAELSEIRAQRATPGELAIAHVVESVVRGNLATTRKLSGVRYPGAEERLARLTGY